MINLGTIIGKLYVVKNWDSLSRWYVQENNITETMIPWFGNKKILEECGISAALNCLDPMGHNIKIKAPSGKLMCPETNLLWEMIRMNPMTKHPNRDGRNYPAVIKAIFGVEPELKWFPKKHLIPLEAEIVNSSKEGRALQVCLKKPGHWIAVNGYDSRTNEVIYKESWKKNYWPRNLKGTSGFNRRVDLLKLVKNLHPLALVYPLRVEKVVDK